MSRNEALAERFIALMRGVPASRRLTDEQLDDLKGIMLRALRGCRTDADRSAVLLRMAQSLDSVIQARRRPH